jgi:hypothetical protein
MRSYPELPVLPPSVRLAISTLDRSGQSKQIRHWIVNANAVLALSIAAQSFKPISMQCSEIPLRDVAASKRSSFIGADWAIPENALTRFSGGEIPGPLSRKPKIIIRRRYNALRQA